MNRILVVGAHPDDELIGLGGTLAKHISKGDEVHVLIMTDGHSSRSLEDDKEAIERRLSALKSSADALGIAHVYIQSFPDQKLDTVPLVDMVKSIEQYRRLVQPNIVYTHHNGDLNYDHCCVYQASITAFRPVGENMPDKIYAYETLSSTEWGGVLSEPFNPNHFVDISEFFKMKAGALEHYMMELRDYPHPRSLKGIEIAAQKWGTVIGVTYAEAFVLIRSID